MNKSLQIKLIIYIIVIFILSTGVSVKFLYDFKDEDIKLSEKILFQEAKAHFDNMLILRSWVAMHGSIYVKQHGDIQPNPYLKDNTLLSDNNETLIKMNPAWVTRQISELSTKNSDYFYKITSMHLVNPKNKANQFEEEALAFFENNHDEKYYYKFNDEKERFDLMGVLKTDAKCISCHENYKIGDIRGGIHVGVPTHSYLEHTSQIEQRTQNLSFIVILFGLFITIISIWLVRYIYKNYKKEKILNNKNILLHKRVAKELEKNRIKDHLLHNQAKSAQMGDMMSMIAHQWRQPLNAISASAIKIDLKHQLGELSDKELSDSSKFIQNKTQEMSEIINDFMNFFKPEYNKSYFLLNDIFEDLDKIVSTQLISKHILYKKDIEGSLELYGHKKELINILINLILNTRDAFEDKDIASKEIDIKVFKTDENIAINICDNAGGIKSEIIGRIFDPYFTTKEQGKGTGIGLYMAKELIKKGFNGNIKVKNIKDGVCFNILLPITTKDRIILSS